ncbi:NAD(P)H-dependent oxidoreductase [Vibrio sp. Of7-15]|uniref:NADPH-dependent FMN reductase n=1 Tax=Vibrio sp. Of7-15 TaxID=2724879 RepID=UPI001EF323DB|nr:NAD(P)H-dependent oxidoreductase [Vibrio sp. Of7-15]MCG7497423.1 NAD(P)H-dependent oxidoreductase [Vibrio sp. Of7-15]
MNILAFAASNNKNSINRTLATYTAHLFDNANVETLDINDYEMPIFSDDREKELGQPAQAKQFIQKIANADAIIVSYAEHNGTFTAAYKNLFDWASRVNNKVYQNKPTLFLSTSPGANGAASVLAAASQSAPYAAADVKASISIPSFHDNFDIKTNQMLNEELKQKLVTAVYSLAS